MALTLPSSLGNPTLPQQGMVRRVATLDDRGQASDSIEGARIAGTAWHRTAAGLQDVGKAYDVLQLNQDQKEAKDWLNALIKDKTDLLYGDGTANNPGYTNLKGDAAVNAAKATSVKLDTLREQYLAKASNKQVSRIFDSTSSALIAPDHEEILKHAGKEHITALTTTNTATVSAATDQLAANPTSDQVAKNSTALIAGSINAQLDIEGITDPLARNQAVIEGVSAAKAAAIQAALVRDPASGAALYAKWKDSIQGTDQAKLEQSIVQAEDRQMRKQEHAAYMDEHYQKINSDKALTDYSKAIIAHAADPTKYPDVSLEAIAADKRLQGPDAITLYNMQRSADKGESDPVVSRRNLASIMPQLMAPYGDPKKLNDYKVINDMMASQKLTKSDWAFAAGIIDQGRSEDGQKIQPHMSSALSAATRVIGKPDINGIFPDDRHAIMLQQWTEDMYNKVEQYKKDNKDPNELFNPKSKDYLLSQDNLRRYQIPMDSSVQHRMDTFTGVDTQDETALPPAPSESLPYPVVANPDDPLYQNLPVGAPYYRMDPKTGQLNQFTKGQPKPNATVSAPTGQ